MAPSHVTSSQCSSRSGDSLRVPKPEFDVAVKAAASHRSRILGRRLTKDEMSALRSGIRAGWRGQTTPPPAVSSSSHCGLGYRNRRRRDNGASEPGMYPATNPAGGNDAGKQSHFLSRIDFVKSGVLEHNPVCLDTEPTPPSSVPTQSEVNSWISDGSRVMDKAIAKFKIMKDTEFRLEFRRGMELAKSSGQKLDLIRQFRVRFPEVDVSEFFLIVKQKPIGRREDAGGGVKSESFTFCFDSNRFESLFQKTYFKEVSGFNHLPRSDRDYEVETVDLDDLP